MKKTFLVMGLLAMSLFAFAGCAKEEEAAVEPAPEKIVVKIAHVEAEDGTLQPASLAFKAYVEEQSKGAIEVQVYPNAELGGDRQATEGVALGTIQMALPSSSVLTSYSGKFGVLDMPFIFKNKEAAFAALDGDLGTALNALLPPVGITCFGYADNGIRHMTNNIRPINEPKDLDGVKMRVMESPVYIEMFKNLGTNATPISYGELYTALQQKTVDGEENSANNIDTAKFYEVQKYMSLTAHTMGFDAVIINTAFFEGLSPENQKIIADGAKIHLIDGQRALATELDEKSMAKLKEVGMIINEITPENHQKFFDMVQPMYEDFKADIGQDMYDLVASYNAKF